MCSWQCLYLYHYLFVNTQNSAKTADGSHLANVTDEEMQVSILLFIACFSTNKVLFVIQRSTTITSLRMSLSNARTNMARYEREK